MEFILLSMEFNYRIYIEFTHVIYLNMEFIYGIFIEFTHVIYF